MRACGSLTGVNYTLMMATVRMAGHREEFTCCDPTGESVVVRRDAAGHAGRQDYRT